METCTLCGSEVSELTVTSDGQEVCDDCLDQYFECEECGGYFPEETGKETEDGTVCQECYENYHRCSDCGVVTKDGTIVDDRFVCQECIDDHYFTCERCDSVEHTDYMVSVDRECWCEHCADNYASTCDCCNEVFRSGDVYTRNITLCSGCRDNYYYCDNCGDFVHSDDVYWDDDESNCYCSDCYRDRSPKVVHDYGYKPYPNFHGKRQNGKTLYLGVELEIEAKNCDRSYLAEKLHDLDESEHNFYLKSDGSLSNGVEVVSHPCTLEYHHKNFPWHDITGKASDVGGRSHDTTTCGLHVHLSRDFFSLTEITRFVGFVNSHAEFLRVLARRGSCDYAKFKDKSMGTKNMVTQKNRYEAVNLENYNTIEVRIFRGTLKAATLYACIELCDAMARFVKQTNIANIINSETENWDSFVDFVKINPVYSNLTAYIEQRGLDRRKVGVADSSSYSNAA